MTYDTRPVSCRSFACLWLKGAGGEEHRPDLCGFVMREIEHPAQPGVALVQVFELVDGALAAGSEGEAAAHEVGYQYPTLMVRRDGTRRAIQPTGGILAPVVLDGKTP